jgi:ribose-phosphate pyrophosphokinase
MDLDALRGDSQFRHWLERLIEEKLREELLREKERNFRESFALISVRRPDPLAESIAEHLGKSLTPIEIVVFGDGEKKTTIHENLRDKDVYVIATLGLGEDPDVSLGNTLKVVSTLRRTCKVRQINLVVPCLWYQAQDKTHARREPITVRDVADDLIRRGMNHIIVLCLHAEQIEIAFDSFDHLKTEPIFADYLARRFGPADEKLVLISPDDGGVRMREELFKNLPPGVVDSLAAVHQLRIRGARDRKELLDFVGDVDGKIGIILDDMMRSGTTMFQAAEAAKRRGAKAVIGIVTHFYGFDSPDLGRFEDRLRASAVDELICVNTRGDVTERVQHSLAFREKLTVLDVSRYIAQAVRNYETGGTVKDMLRVSDIREFYRVAHRAGDRPANGGP